jgi:hypothetical protein
MSENTQIEAILPPQHLDDSGGRSHLAESEAALNNVLASLGDLEINTVEGRISEESLPTAGVPNAFDRLQEANTTGVRSVEVPNAVTGVPDIVKLEASSPTSMPEESFEAPKGLSKLGRQNFERLDQANREKKKKIKELEAEVATLKANGVPQIQTVVPVELQNELQQLRSLRDMYFIEQSGYVKQWDDAIRQAEIPIVEVLVSKGMHLYEKDAEEYAKQTGKPIPHSVESLYRAGLHLLPAEFWEENIFPALNFLEKSKIEKALVDSLSFRQQKNQGIQNLFDRREELKQQAELQRQMMLDEEKKIVYSELEQYYKYAPWAKRLEMPQNPTPDQKKAVDAHNKVIDGYEALFKAAYNPVNVRTKVQVAAYCVLAERLNTENIALKKALDDSGGIIRDLEGRLKGIKRSTSIPHTTVTPQADKVELQTPSGYVPTARNVGVHANIDAAMKSFGL